MRYTFKLEICIFLLIWVSFITTICNIYQTDDINNVADTTVIISDKVTSLEKKLEAVTEENENLKERLDKIVVVDYDYEYVVGVVSTECGNEPFEGQMAVAQVISERAKEFNISPEEVVKTLNQFAPPTPVEKINEDTWKACNKVLIGGEKVTDKPIKTFYSPTGGFYSAWHEAREYVMTIGGHRFFV